MHAVAERLRLDVDELMCDDRLCNYLTHSICEDEAYATLIASLREYRRYAGVSRRSVTSLMYALGRFSINPNCATTRAWMAHLFRTTLAELERARASSLIRRDFVGDYCRDDSGSE